MKMDARHYTEEAVRGRVSVEDAIMEWASDNIFELQPYIREMIGTDQYGKSDVPISRRELGERFKEMQGQGWEATRFLSMGQVSAEIGRVDERDRWFVLYYDSEVESLTDAEAASRLLRLFRTLLPGILDGSIMPPSDDIGKIVIIWEQSEIARQVYRNDPQAGRRSGRMVNTGPRGPVSRFGRRRRDDVRRRYRHGALQADDHGRLLP